VTIQADHAEPYTLHVQRLHTALLSEGVVHALVNIACIVTQSVEGHEGTLRAASGERVQLGPAAPVAP
jgi:hypothetical protein